MRGAPELGSGDWGLGKSRNPGRSRSTLLTFPPPPAPHPPPRPHLFLVPPPSSPLTHFPHSSGHPLTVLALALPHQPPAHPHHLLPRDRKTTPLTSTPSCASSI